MENVELKNDLLLRVARGLPVERPPVWLMRQAGRFLKEYRDVRAEAGSFRNMISHPEYAAEVTIQPVDLIGVDAAIIFSDILVVPEAMGMPYEMIPGKGPLFPIPIRSASQVANLHAPEGESNLDHTFQAIRLTKKRLQGRVPLIGFAGAPWTLFCYMVEGSGSKTFSVARSMIYREPRLAEELLSALTQTTIAYLKGQIAAGVDIVQLFDSWGGLLDTETYRRFSLRWLREICAAIDEVPIIVYAKGAGFALGDLNELDCQVIGLDWHSSPDMAMSVIPHKALQGNMDPAQLYASKEEVEAATLRMLNSFPAGRHIVNLGHGIYPDLPRENVQAFVETVHSYRYSAIGS